MLAWDEWTRRDGPPLSDTFFFHSIRYLVFFSIRYDIDTVFWPLNDFFLRNFWEFIEFSANSRKILGNFWRILGIFGKFSGIFSRFLEFSAKKKKKKITILQYQRYSILEVQYSILWKVSRSRVSRIFRYDILNPALNNNSQQNSPNKKRQISQQ